MNLMEMAKKREVQQKKLQLALERLQELQNEKNRIETILDGLNKKIAQEVAGEAKKPLSREDMRRLYEEHSYRFNSCCWPNELAQAMADGTLQPNAKGIFTVLDALAFAEDFERVNYKTIYNAMRKIAKVYNIAWPSHAAGMKVC